MGRQSLQLRACLRKSITIITLKSILSIRWPADMSWLDILEGLDRVITSQQLGLADPPSLVTPT